MPTHTSTAPFPIPRPSLLAILTILLSSLWASLVSAADKTAADYYIDALPDAPEPHRDMWAGHIEVNPQHHGNLFFWLFQNRHVGDKERLVIWLNGGPGCSSMDGAMMEIGPYRVLENGTLGANEGSWDEFANVLFVDQPVGTGFSYADTDSYVHDMAEMSAQMVVFLEKFFTIFPQYEFNDVS
jgi:carboxypeptidase D